jgi:hypothetical protein
VKVVQPGAGRLRLAVVATAMALAGVGAAGCGGARSGAGAVLDHVHGAAAGATGADVILATHYGLVRSADGGRSWTKYFGLGEEMVS